MTITRNFIIPQIEPRTGVASNPPLITTVSLTNATQGLPYSFTMSATGGVPPYSWSMTSSDPAFSIDPASGTITGTALVAETVTLRIRVTDSLATPTAPTNFQLTVNAGSGAGAPQAIFRGYVQTTSLLITWWPTTADTGSNGTTYNVYQNNAKVASGIIPIPNTLSTAAALMYVAKPLQPSTTYSFFVTATQGGVETLPTQTLTLTTLSATPGSTLPTPPTDPATWLPPTSGIVLPSSGTTWSATITTETDSVNGTAGTGPKGNVGCSFQYALNNAVLNDVIVLTAGATYKVSGGTANGAWHTQPLPSSGGTLYVVSSQCPELGGALPACSYVAQIPTPQNITLTAAVPSGATSATLTTPWTGRTGYFNATFIPQVSGAKVSQTFSPLIVAGATSATLASGNWTGPTGYVYLVWNFTTATGGGTSARLAVATNGSPTLTWASNMAAINTPTNTGTFTAGLGPETHPVLFTNGSTAIQWTSPMMAACTTAATVVTGNWVTPADAGYNTATPNMPTLQFNTVVGQQVGISFQTGGASTNNMRFIGIYFAPIPSLQTSALQACVLLPYAKSLAGGDPILPDNLTFDRCLFGNDSGLLGAGTYSLLRNASQGSANHLLFHQCYVWDTGDLGSEAHGFSTYGGGPQCVQNCYISAVSIGCFTGGFFQSPNQASHDLVWRYNYSCKLDQWRLNHLGDWVKNHWEWKEGQRAEGYGNFSQTCWAGAAGQQSGRVWIAGARDQFANSNVPITAVNTLSPWINVADINIHDNVNLQCGQGLETFTSDYGPSQYTERVRYVNNLTWLNAGTGGTRTLTGGDIGIQAATGVSILGEVADLIFDRDTIIINPAMFLSLTTSFNSQLGRWASNWTAYTPNIGDAFSVRSTYTNNIMDGSAAVWGSTFLASIDQSTWTWADNLTLPTDTHTYPSPFYKSVPYANIGFTSFVDNTTQPGNPANWNVTGATIYATGSTTGGPVGSFFGGPQILTASLPAAVVGTAYSQSLSASGGTPPYTYNWVSMAPNSGMWLNVDPAGIVYGIPQYNETSNTVLQINDATGAFSQKTLTVQSAATGALAVVTSSLPNATNGGMYVCQLLATGGVPPYHWTTTLGAPFTCQDDGALTATPTATGTFSGTVTVTDSTGATATSGTLTAIVDNVLRFNFYDFVDNQIRFPSGYSGQLYGDFATRLSASGGTPPYTFSLFSGSLNGLTISASGGLSGTPTSAGALKGTVQVTDSASGLVRANSLLNVFSPGKVSRPAYNATVANGFFVSGGRFYDPNGYPATIRGFNRAHYAAAAPGPHNFLGMNALHPNSYRLFTFNAAAGGSTPAQIENDCNAIGIAFDELPIPVVSIIPGTNTAITGTYTPTNLGLAVNYWVANFSTYSPIQGKLVLNVANEWDLSGTGGPGNPNAQFQTYYAQTSNAITSISGTTVTLNSAASTNPFASVVGLGQVFIKGSTATNGIYACATSTGGVSGAWTVTLSSSAGSGTGGTLYGGCVGILRAAGYTCPIMIDAGQDSPGTPNNIINYAAAIQASDPLQNCIFSQHAYNYTTPFQNQIKSVATSGVNTVLTLNNGAATHPFQQLASFFPEVGITVQGAAGTGWTAMNGTWTVNHGANFGGIAGAWTITIPFNSSSLVVGNYTSNSGVAFDFANPQVTAAQFAALRGSNVCVIYGEFGPYGSAGNPQTYLRPTDVIQAAEANQLGWLAWAWDDGFVGFALVNNGTAGFYQHISDITATYGQDLVMHPRMSPVVLSIAAPIFGV